MALAELVVGSGFAYIFARLRCSDLSSVRWRATAGAMTGLRVHKIVCERRQRAWIGVMDAIAEAAP